MIISTNWLKKFTTIDMPIDALATLIGARLVEIEEVIDLSKKYKDVIVARVVEVHPLEGSDHLNIAKIDDGGAVSEIERDENGYVQVICGAPNVRVDMRVAWLPPQSIVPSTHSDSAPFVLEARKVRGEMSNGMIASARELDLFDEHDGILALDDTLQPGSHFAEAYELDDVLFDIENKSLTHRPDTFGIVGFAREVAAIQGKVFQTPDWLANTTPHFIKKEGALDAPSVTIDTPELSARYQAVVLSNADGSAQSPLHIQTYLARVGIRPISAIVDVTNYLMMLTGQPLHAFDYDKLVRVAGGKAEIHVRAAHEGETLRLLDGRLLELTEDDIVIVGGTTPVALAGAMGGADTEIDTNTKNIIVESATFNLYNLRATQMRHGIFSEAITRFTKGQPAALTAPVLAQAVQLMHEYAGAMRASDVGESYPGRQDVGVIQLTADKINGVLGTQLTANHAAQVMKNVEFSTTVTNETIEFTPPYWRSDIHIDEDVIEEIGRLSGFDTIEPSLPMRDFTATQPSRFDALRMSVRRALVRAGANEVLTYSFVHGTVLQKAGQVPADSYRVVNSISPDLQYYRQTLTPSLLGVIHSNIKQDFDRFALFEVNKVHPKQHGMTHEGVPSEIDMVALTFADKHAKDGAAYYQAKKILDYLAISLGLDLEYAAIDDDPHYPVTAPFESRRSAVVSDKKTKTFIGIVGEYKKSVARGFKLPEYTAGFEIGSIPLLEAVQKLSNSYTPLSRFPSTERDICFKVASSVTYRQIIEVIESVLNETDLEAKLSPVDIYQVEGAATKNITIRIRLTARDRTLAGNEVVSVCDRVASRAGEALDADIV
jgi:phenylalanyl-tRNA synthetase beta chain